MDTRNFAVADTQYQGETEIGRKLIGAIREIAGEQPDFIYRDKIGTCLYVDMDRQTGEFSPGCIVGQAMWRTGVITAGFYYLGGRDVDVYGDLSAIKHGDWNAETIDNLYQVFDKLEGLSVRDVRWLRNAQTTQDRGRPWAMAVLEADAKASGIYDE